MPEVILIPIASLLITFLSTPLTIILAKKIRLVDDPKTRPHPAHTHKGIIPRGGGLPLFLGIFLPVLFMFPFTGPIVGIFFGSAILILVGLWDDRKDRSPYIRFATNSLAALLVIGVGIRIPYITNPFGGIISLDTFKVSFDFLGSHQFFILADIIAFIWIIWTTNIVGWSGGVDGQLPGFVAISSLVIGILSFRFASLDPQQFYVTYLCLATAGAFLGFLPWNFYPQKIMPGYGGKTLAGFMLAILSILSFSKLGTALLVLSVPMIDAAFIFTGRILAGKSPVWATSGHLHHRLLSLGWSKRRIAIFYWLISAIVGMAALMLNSKQKLFVGVLIVVLFVGFILWINFIRKFTRKKDSEAF
jgi:UDP-GlcNAc:undecaprenyl-phosphate GlcNAc-1-phosphate transferase